MKGNREWQSEELILRTFHIIKPSLIRRPQNNNFFADFPSSILNLERREGRADLETKSSFNASNPVNACRFPTFDETIPATYKQ